MAEWVDLEDIMEEQMKQPGFKERFDKSYSEFTKRIDSELAAERVQVPTAAVGHAPRRRPAYTSGVPA